MQLHKLKPLQVARASKPGMYADGGGLYLQVMGPGARSWVYRFTLKGRERYLGLGSASAIGLARARELATEARALRAEGKDPIEERRHKRTEDRINVARAMTFKDCGDSYLKAHETAWRNPKHKQQWR